MTEFKRGDRIVFVEDDQYGGVEMPKGTRGTYDDNYCDTGVPWVKLDTGERVRAWRDYIAPAEDHGTGDGSASDICRMFVLTAHTPAPEPEPEWKPGTTGTATLNNRVSGNSSVGLRAMRTLRGGVYGFAFANGLTVTDDATTYGVTDFVPDEARPLPTQDAVRKALEPGWSMDSMTAMTDGVMALLRGEAR